MIWLAALLFSTQAMGQSVQADRPPVPSAGLAAEGGPGALWVNPANQAYDPDMRYGLFVTHDLGLDPTSFAATWGTAGIGLGVQNVSTPGGSSNWTLDYATSIALPERIAVGLRVAWHLTDEERNFLGYDVGGSWRPLPWVGFGAVARNISSPHASAPAQSGVGVAFRPFGPFAVLGADYLHTFHEADPHDVLQASLRVRPTRGVYLRASGDSDGRIGGGVEVFFGRAGAGAYASATDAAVGITSFVGTDEPGEAIVRSGHQFPVVVLDQTPPYAPTRGLFGSNDTSWLEIVELLRRAEEDPSIRGLVVVLGRQGMSWAHSQEIRTRILSLEASGKHCVVYLHGGASTNSYFVASAASKVVMHPAQDLDLTGISWEMAYFRGAFDMLGVEPQYVRRAEYKSAPESNLATGPSPESLEQMEALLDDMFQGYLTGIAATRRRDAAEVSAWIDGGPWTAREALSRGMVDALAYPDEVEAYVEEMHQHSVKLMTLDDIPQPHSGWLESDQIAIVYVDGAIVPGRSSPGGPFGARTAGSETIVQQLNAARENDQVRAIVLRVDSPGGSSFASDEIHRAVERLKAEGKPVVVSMGSMAASGGYYVSAGADAIWAEPGTITGSIGVYAGKMSMDGLLEKVGVSTTSVTRGRNAGIWSATQPWDEMQAARMQALVDQTYADFKQKVEQGRGLSPEQVEQVARGRVWSGHRAMENGLVDGIGGLHDAIKDARVRAGIGDNEQVALVTYDTRGVLGEALSPTQMRLHERVLATVFPEITAALAQAGQSPLPVLPPEVGAAWAPASVLAQHPDEVWMMDPMLAGITW